MNTTNPVHAEDVFPVTRISWSAILAGAVVALAFQFLFGIFGAAWQCPYKMAPIPHLQHLCCHLGDRGRLRFLFVGGMVATVLTTGENKTESILYGIIVWATVLAIVAHGAAESRRNGRLRWLRHAPGQHESRLGTRCP